MLIKFRHDPGSIKKIVWSSAWQSQTIIAIKLQLIYDCESLNCGIGIDDVSGEEPMDKELIRRSIRRAKLRATASRISVMDSLYKAARPLAHSELVESLVPEGFDRASIFRNLIDLTEAGLVSRTDLGDHVWRFFAHDSEDPSSSESHYTRHPHFVCIECGGVQCLESVEVFVKKGRRQAPKSIGRKDVEINFRGYCDDCSTAP
jgi:Fur family ferric uptake transcriptional regulator